MLDSQAPSIPVKAYAYNEIRYKMLSYTNPDEAKRLLGLAQEDVNQRWRVYSEHGRPLAGHRASAARASRQPRAGAGRRGS